MTVLVVISWSCAGLLVSTHAVYPAVTALLTRVRSRRLRRDNILPTVARRIEKLRAPDYSVAALVLVLLAAVLAGCGGSSAPKERVGTFVTRILREEINGQWGAQWTELHPAHQQLITRAQYVTCSREIGTDIATGNEIFTVLAVRDESIHVARVGQHAAKLVTISFRQRGSKVPFIYHVHAVAVHGRWAWVLGPKFLTEIARGRCLDGSPLRPNT